MFHGPMQRRLSSKDRMIASTCAPSVASTGPVWVILSEAVTFTGLDGSITSFLEVQGNSASRLVSPVRHVMSPVLPIVNLFSRS